MIMTENLNKPITPLRTDNPRLDDFLLDIATQIELTDFDRQIADQRYKLLKEVLTEPRTALAQYIAKDEGRIYPHGSMATGTTVICGQEDERYDVDAIVELNLPENVSATLAMQLLYEALENFPDVQEVEKCTRCIQLRFSRMHMDVTILIPQHEIGIQGAGNILHVPDKGEPQMIPANPWGFAQWFRNKIAIPEAGFPDYIARRRAHFNSFRDTNKTRDLSQDDLPAVIAPRLDSESIVAFKLLKRYLAVCYSNRDVRRPPSIYLSKLVADLGDFPFGLYAQLITLTQHVEGKLKELILMSQFPDERNPSYTEDRLNDRWPTNIEDMKLLSKDLEYLRTSLENVKSSQFAHIVTVFSKLFGERISKYSAQMYMNRDEKSAASGSMKYESGSGHIMATGTLATAKTKVIKPHDFHFDILE